MRVGIMQPYFLPYIGYFQLISAVDLFIVYDNIKYTKKGWINRNRILLNGADTTFSLPLKKDSDYLNVVNRELSSDFSREKFLNQMRGAYLKAPQFHEVLPMLQKIVEYDSNNLFRYIYNSILEICRYIDVKTKICLSSEVSINHDLKSQDKVIALCKAVDAKIYINTSGGTDLYSMEAFDAAGLQLNFIKSLPIEYHQFSSEFVPWLSIIDVLMFNPKERVSNKLLQAYNIIKPSEVM
jgi:hypothetical protein